MSHIAGEIDFISSSALNLRAAIHTVAPAVAFATCCSHTSNNQATSPNVSAAPLPVTAQNNASSLFFTLSVNVRGMKFSCISHVGATLQAHVVFWGRGSSSGRDDDIGEVSVYLFIANWLYEEICLESNFNFGSWSCFLLAFTLSNSWPSVDFVYNPAKGTAAVFCSVSCSFLFITGFGLKKLVVIDFYYKILLLFLLFPSEWKSSTF